MQQLLSRLNNTLEKTRNILISIYFILFSTITISNVIGYNKKRKKNTKINFKNNETSKAKRKRNEFAIKLAYRRGKLLNLKYIFYGVFRKQYETKPICIAKEIQKIHNYIVNMKIKQNNAYFNLFMYCMITIIKHKLYNMHTK